MTTQLTIIEMALSVEKPHKLNPNSYLVGDPWIEEWRNEMNDNKDGWLMVDASSNADDLCNGDDFPSPWQTAW